MRWGLLLDNLQTTALVFVEAKPISITQLSAFVSSYHCPCGSTDLSCSSTWELLNSFLSCQWEIGCRLTIIGYIKTKYQNEHESKNIFCSSLLYIMILNQNITMAFCFYQSPFLSESMEATTTLALMTQKDLFGIWLDRDTSRAFIPDSMISWISDS